MSITEKVKASTDADVMRLQARVVELEEASRWRPIATAPKDGQMVDLWCVDPSGEFVPELGGIRLADCAWNEASVVFPQTGWVRILPDGDYDLVEYFSNNPLGLPPWKPTHWQPLPPPPTA